MKMEEKLLVFEFSKKNDFLLIFIKNDFLLISFWFYDNFLKNLHTSFIFIPKKAKISNFELNNWAESMYNKDSTRKNNIAYKKILKISIFSFLT